MKYYYDLHIHSVLSSCADVLNTPNNILNMCMLKELQFISITDHNSARQYESINLLKDSYDFFILYGMEVTVEEGFHVLTYFKRYEDLCVLSKIIDSYLDKNVTVQRDKILDKDIFQVVTDEYDEIKETIPYLLNQKSISFSELINVARRFDSLIIPAHINRGSTGILKYYPDFSNFDIDAIEIYNKDVTEDILNRYPYLKKYKILYNSDAHDIDIINEKVNYIELDSLDYESFKKYLKQE